MGWNNQIAAGPAWGASFPPSAPWARAWSRPRELSVVLVWFHTLPPYGIPQLMRFGKALPAPCAQSHRSSECHLQEFLGHLQGWALQTSLPTFSNPFHEGIPAALQPEPPLAQLEAVALLLLDFPGYPWKRKALEAWWGDGASSRICWVQSYEIPFPPLPLTFPFFWCHRTAGLARAAPQLHPRSGFAAVPGTG